MENRSTVPTTGTVIPQQEEEGGEGTSQLSLKRQKLDTTDPLAAFRTGISSTSTSTDEAGVGNAGFNYNTLDEYKAALLQDLRKYSVMRGPFETSTSAAQAQDCDCLLYTSDAADE